MLVSRCDSQSTSSPAWPRPRRHRSSGVVGAHDSHKIAEVGMLVGELAPRGHELDHIFVANRDLWHVQVIASCKRHPARITAVEAALCVGRDWSRAAQRDTTVPRPNMEKTHGTAKAEADTRCRWAQRVEGVRPSWEGASSTQQWEDICWVCRLRRVATRQRRSVATGPGRGDRRAGRGDKCGQATGWRGATTCKRGRWCMGTPPANNVSRIISELTQVSVTHRAKKK